MTERGTSAPLPVLSRGRQWTRIKQFLMLKQFKLESSDYTCGRRSRGARSGEQRRVSYCPINQPAVPQCFVGLDMNFSQNNYCRLDVKQQSGVKGFGEIV